MATLTDLLLSNEATDHEAFVEKLRPIVVGELKERNLFGSPSAWLGYGGTWQDPDRVEDLVLDVYTAILARRPAISAQRTQHPDLDPMIRRNVRNFFNDRQHKHDPLGFSVYQNVVGGLQRAVASGSMSSLDQELRGWSLMQYPSWCSDSHPADEQSLKSAVLSQGAADEFISSLAKISDESQTSVEQRVSNVPTTDPGIEGFHCRALANPLKTEVRAAAMARASNVDVARDDDDEGSAPSDKSPLIPVTTPDPSAQLVLINTKRRIEESNLSDTLKRNLLLLLSDFAEDPEASQAARADRLRVAPQTVADWIKRLRDLLGGDAR
jgi:hypothetical protein